MRVFTISERLANQMKTGDIGEVGNFVKRTEIDAPRVGKLVEKSEICDPKSVQKSGMGDLKTETLVKKSEMGGPNVGNIEKV